MRTNQNSNQAQYISSLMNQESKGELQSRLFAEQLGLGRISLSTNEAGILEMMIRLHGGEKFVEIGTLTGLSMQAILRALPENAKLWTLEKNTIHADYAAQALMNSELSEKKKLQVQFIVGDARQTLQEMTAQSPFDGVFIDGNKAAYLDYLKWSEENIKPGGIIIADNVFLSGAVWGEETKQKFSEKQIRVMQEFNRSLFNFEKYFSALIPTEEGMIVAIKK